MTFEEMHLEADKCTCKEEVSQMTKRLKTNTSKEEVLSDEVILFFFFTDTKFSNKAGGITDFSNTKSIQLRV